MTTSVLIPKRVRDILNRNQLILLKGALLSNEARYSEAYMEVLKSGCEGRELWKALTNKILIPYVYSL